MSDTSDGPSPVTEAEVFEYEERLREAMLHSDVAELDALLSPDLVFNNHHGIVLGKDDDLAAHGSRDLKLESLELSAGIIRCFGDSAVVSFQVDLSGSFLATPVAGSFRFTRVWARNAEGKLQVVVGQSTAIADPS